MTLRINAANHRQKKFAKQGMSGATFGCPCAFALLDPTHLIRSATPVTFTHRAFESIHLVADIEHLAQGVEQLARCRPSIYPNLGPPTVGRQLLHSAVVVPPLGIVCKDQIRAVDE